MKFLRLVLLLSLCAGAVTVPALAQNNAQNTEEHLTNAAVIKLVQAGFSEKAVISIIRSRPTRFVLSADRLIELKRSRVSERIILAMLARENANALENEDWDSDDDAFDSNDMVQPNTKPGEKTDSGETKIFGSSGGSRGKTRERGGKGSTANDTQTTGSVTARIVRPSETGGPTPKLERTPLLNNDAIIKLVEAGFTEGTIIRRIEQSPVDFDLSPNKLDELRRHRVTENVIAAMKAAMGDDKPSSPNQTSPEK